MRAVSQAPASAPALGLFIPVSVDSLGEDLDRLDLYLKHRWEDEPTLYRPAGVPLSQDDRERLRQQRLNFLYIPASQHAAYRDAVRERLETQYQDADLRETARAQAVRATCGRMIEELLAAPATAESLDGALALGKQFAAWAIEDESKFSYLLDMSAHDFYTATHMLNVGVGCGLLARALRPNDETLLAQCVQGGLLHDVGKRDVSAEILNKENGLTEEEWEIIKTHPVKGYEELASSGVISRVALEMTRWHHERVDGRGYPDGIAGRQVTFPARLCAVVDAYDAITSGRPYRPPVAPRDALALLRQGAGDHFDAEMLKVWTGLIERLLEQDPQRSFERQGPPPALTLDDLFPESPDPVAESPPIHKKSDPNDRRAHPRIRVSTRVDARFVRQVKPYRVRVGQVWGAETVDCSRGGACLSTPWPLARGDVLDLKLHTAQANGKPRIIQKYALVVNVHCDDDGAWTAGVRFVNDPDDPYAL